MSERTIRIISDRGHHSVEIGIPQVILDKATKHPRSKVSIALSLKLGEEIFRLLAIPAPDTTVRIEVGNGS